MSGTSRTNLSYFALSQGISYKALFAVFDWYSPYIIYKARCSDGSKMQKVN